MRLYAHQSLFGFHTQRLIKSSNNKMAAQNMVAGPWGGAGGVAWSYSPKHQISHITITYGDYINTLRFTTRDELGNMLLSDKFGSQDGEKIAEIDVDAAKFEKMIGISGTYGVGNDPPCLTSLSFTTDENKSYGPFGSGKGTSFSFQVNDGESIIGFFGRNGWLMDSIGVYLKPKTKLSVGPWGSVGPGNEWSYEPKGFISNISITHDDVIGSLTFTSQDAKGKVERSKTYGTYGSKRDEIVIDIKNGEKINYIRGTIDLKGQYVSVMSLTFSTNKNRTFGPFGTVKVEGERFSFRAKDQGFVGFHGRAGQWLDAIGVHLKPVPEQSSGFWGRQTEGHEWTYKPKGAISQISITHDDPIYSITFTSIDEEGNVESSKTFGQMTGSKTNVVVIDVKKEKLNNISGTFATRGQYVVVTSLTLTTDKKKVFGPFGTVRGTNFSLQVNNGHFSGFFGRSGSWLDAIGVLIKPTE